MLSSSRLLDNIRRLSSLSGEFFFYEPRERLLNSVSGSPLQWETVCPNEASSLSMGELDRYSLSLLASLGSSVTKLSPEEAALLLCQKRLWRQCALLWVSDHCLSGDYCGAPYTASNCRSLLREFGKEESPEIREAVGSYGSSSVAVDPRYLSEDLLEALESLEAYPVFCEEDSSELELELIQEAWDGWASSEFSSLLEDRLSQILDSEEEASELVSGLPCQTLWQTFDTLREASNTYWEAEHLSMWIKLERILEDAEDSLVLSLVSEI